MKYLYYSVVFLALVLLMVCFNLFSLNRQLSQIQSLASSQSSSTTSDDYQTLLKKISELDLNWFRLELKAYEAAEYGIYLYKTHNHNTEVTLGSLTFARVIEILPPYTITFEDGQYAVNLVNANSNVADRTNVNQVSVRSSNSAGLVVSTATVTTNDINAIADAVWDELVSSHSIPGSTGKTLRDTKTKATLASLK